MIRYAFNVNRCQVNSSARCICVNARPNVRGTLSRHLHGSFSSLPLLLRPSFPFSSSPRYARIPSTPEKTPSQPEAASPQGSSKSQLPIYYRPSPSPAPSSFCCVNSRPKRRLSVTRCRDHLSSGEKRAGCADLVTCPWPTFLSVYRRVPCASSVYMRCMSAAVFVLLESSSPVSLLLPIEFRAPMEAWSSACGATRVA